MQPNILVVVDSGVLSNILLPDDYDSNCLSQAGLTLNLTLTMLRLGRPANVHLKVNIMSSLPFQQYLVLGQFLISEFEGGIELGKLKWRV
jgi:hypothetical protein